MQLTHSILVGMVSDENDKHEHFQCEQSTVCLFPPSILSFLQL